MASTESPVPATARYRAAAPVVVFRCSDNGGTMAEQTPTLSAEQLVQLDALIPLVAAIVAELQDILSRLAPSTPVGVAR